MLHLRFSSSFILRGVKEGPERGRTLIEMLAVLVIIGIMVIAGLTGLSLAMRKVKVENNIKDMNLVAVDIFSEPVNFARTNIGQGIVFRGMSGSKQTATKTAEDMFSVSMTNLETSVCEDMFEQAHNYEMIHESTFTQPDICVNGQAIFYYQLDNHINDNQGCGYGMVWNETAGMCCRSFTVPDSSECRIYTETSASKGVCPDYTQTNLSGPCGTNGYCNNGECVPCPATSESCSIESDEYDTETQCLLTKKVTCGENEICTNGSCVCSNGYELYNGVCLPICNGSGMTGDRDEEGNCQCIEGTNADTCACPDGYIYLNGTCQRFECRNGTTGYTFNCFINEKICGQYCKNDGSFCLWGTCVPSYCDSVTGSSYFISPYGWGGCELGDRRCVPIYTEDRSFSSWRCLDEAYADCCDATTEFGVCTIGSCYENPCTEYEGAIFERKINHYWKGCTFNEQLHCILSNNERNRWQCFINGNLCNSSCENPLTNCPGCALNTCFHGSTFDEKSQMCTKDGIYCDNQNCYFDAQKTKVCGAQCQDPNGFAYCFSGACFNEYVYKCPSGFDFQYIDFQNRGGCTNGRLSCVWESAASPANCFYDGQACGSRCQLDGTNCQIISSSHCNDTPYCIEGQIEAPNIYGQDCICSSGIEGIDKNGNKWCCPFGHIFINGGCTLIECPEGQEPDENGICKDVS